MDDNAPQSQGAPVLPSLVTLVEFRWKWRGQPYDASEIPGGYAFGTEPLERVVLPKESGNFVILSPLKRGHRRYKTDQDLSDNSYYVGIEGGLFTPVFIRGLGKRPSPDMRNSYGGVRFGIGLTNKLARIIVPPVEMLRPRQLTFLKVQSLGTEHHPKDEPAFRPVSGGEREQYQKCQQDAFLNGRRCPVFIQNPTTEPDYNVLKHMTKDNWQLFHMDMPKLADIRIPKGLVDEIKSFLAKYPRDIVPINLAVSMAIVWWAYSNTTLYQPELLANYNRKPLEDRETPAINDRAVPPVELAVLILYSTHYFRIHEEHELSAYAHIFRIISSMYKKDKCFDAAFGIDVDHIDHKLVSLYISGMALREEDWVEIVPPSFDGSRIPMPKNHGARAPPSPELTTSLMMPNIYTLGFPGYTNETRKGYGEVVRDVMMHKSWVPRHVLAGTGWTALDQDHLDLATLEPYHDHDRESRQLWTAPQTMTRQPWPDIVTFDIPLPPSSLEGTPSSAITATAAVVEQDPLATSNPNGPAFEKLCPRDLMFRALADHFTLHVAHLRMAQEAGLISKLVTLGSDGHLTWPSQPKHFEDTTKLPYDMDAKRLFADAAAAAKDRISEGDRRILRRILEEDLASGKHVANCLQAVRSIDVNDGNLTTQCVLTALAAAAEPIQKAMKQVLNCGGSIRAGDWDVDDFTHNLVRPCCKLLGLGNSGTPLECKDAIHHAERELHAAINNVEFVVRYQRDNVEPFKIAMDLITSAHCFRYISRLTMFNMRLRGARFKEDDKNLWAGIFSEPFEDDKRGK
ncbi:hypothetical protein LX32DRAFT_610101 [Colletotrichum zoysiae]|uniref:Uncharacterized protein n=1 Tax=Colletotrichum zoysiae TaxID=1216348 RepID=A0AAD9M6E0_9PEZI|nr:hypothetical protein LX32DRAFT_610101 [Colletotrichum zoysiae]